MTFVVQKPKKIVKPTKKPDLFPYYTKEFQFISFVQKEIKMNKESSLNYFKIGAKHNLSLFCAFESHSLNCMQFEIMKQLCFKIISL